MPVVGMQLLQLAGEGVSVGGCEHGFTKAADGVEHVQRPATFLHRKFFERFDLLEFLADFFGRSDLFFRDDGNPRLGGDAGQIKIATDPAGALRRGRQRRAFNDGRRRKGKGRHQQQIADAPRCQIVMQEKVAGRAVFLDGFHHCGISAVADGLADGRFLAFELIPKAAMRAVIIARLGSRPEPIQFWRGTIRAIKVFRAPSLRDIAGLLRTAFETVGQRAGHGKIHKANLVSSPKPFQN